MATHSMKDRTMRHFEDSMTQAIYNLAQHAAALYGKEEAVQAAKAAKSIGQKHLQELLADCLEAAGSSLAKDQLHGKTQQLVADVLAQVHHVSESLSSKAKLGIAASIALVISLEILGIFWLGKNEIQRHVHGVKDAYIDPALVQKYRYDDGIEKALGYNGLAGRSAAKGVEMCIDKLIQLKREGAPDEEIETFRARLRNMMLRYGAGTHVKSDSWYVDKEGKLYSVDHSKDKTRSRLATGIGIGPTVSKGGGLGFGVLVPHSERYTDHSEDVMTQIDDLKY